MENEEITKLLDRMLELECRYDRLLARVNILLDKIEERERRPSNQPPDRSFLGE